MSVVRLERRLVVATALDGGFPFGRSSGRGRTAFASVCTTLAATTALALRPITGRSLGARIFFVPRRRAVVVAFGRIGVGRLVPRLRAVVVRRGLRRVMSDRCGRLGRGRRGRLRGGSVAGVMLGRRLLGRFGRGHSDAFRRVRAGAGAARGAKHSARVCEIPPERDHVLGHVAGGRVRRRLRAIFWERERRSRGRARPGGFGNKRAGACPR